MHSVEASNRTLLRDPAVDHVSELDGIRGVALAIVVGYHMLRAFWVPSPTWVQGSYVGLDMFFVLSGFLVTSLLLRERERTGHVRTRSFYGRRISRLIPALLLFFVAHGIYVIATGMSKRGELRQMVTILFGFTNIPRSASGPTPDGMQHLWSLSIEWQFYLIAPLLIGVLFYRLSDRIVMIILGAAIVAVTGWRLLLHDHGISFFLIYVRTDTRADTIFAGILLAYSRKYIGISNRLATVFGWLGIAIFVTAIIYFPLGTFYLYEPLVIAAAIMILIAATAESKSSRVFKWKPLIVLGTVSYALYLWHLFIFLAINHYFPDWDRMVKAIVGLALTALATAFSWYAVEKPVQRLRRRRRDAMRSVSVVEAAADSP